MLTKDNFERSKKFTSPTWAKMIELSNVKELLDSHKIDLNNFRNTYSVGLDNSNNLRQKPIFTIKTEILFDRIKKLINQNNYGLLYDSEFGNPEIFEIDGKKFTFSTLEFALYFDYIEKQINFNKINTVLEIGAGVGFLARNIKKKYSHIKYINVDLPHSNLMFKSYQNHYFTDCSFNDDFTNNRELKDFNILNCWEIELLKKNSIDLAINMRSFQEMNHDICNYYLDNIRKSLSENSHFLYINRLHKQNRGRGDNYFTINKLNLNNFKINKFRTDFFKKRIMIIFFKYNSRFNKTTLISDRKDLSKTSYQAKFYYLIFKLMEIFHKDNLTK